MSGFARRAARIARTVRHLKSRQLLYQLLRRSRPPRLAPLVARAWDPVRAPAVFESLRLLGPVAGPTETGHTAREWLARRLTAAGSTVPWEGDWGMDGPSPLWRYHLHYHDHLADLAWYASTSSREIGASAARRLEADLADWHTTWGDGGAPAWDAYPVSVRLANWLRIEAWMGEALSTETRDRLRHGVSQKVELLSRSLEWHLDGNHLLRDAWALCLGTIALSDSPRSSEVREWHTLFAVLMGEQVLGDGWHVERSPMYHARALRDALELDAAAESAGVPLDAATRERIADMRAAMPWMLRVDGSLWALNDTAQDFGLDVRTLMGDGARAEGVRWFAAAGAACLVDRRHGDGLRIDLGAPGPAHQPAHAHAGALGFEIDMSGIPFCVDGGCSGYDGDPWREYFRGTAAHNTVTIDDHDQSEMWATFRVGGRARVDSVECEGDVNEFRARGICRPWFRPDSAHDRMIRRRGRTVVIEDVVHGTPGSRVSGYLHLAPDWLIERAGPTSFVARHASALATITVDGADATSLHRGEERPPMGWRATGFGRVLPSWTLRATTVAGRSWRTTISPR